jgi:hypothetical protein
MTLKSRLKNLENSITQARATGSRVECRMDRLSTAELLWWERTALAHRDRSGSVDLSGVSTADLRRMHDLQVIASSEVSDAQAVRFRELLAVLAPYRREDHNLDHYKLSRDLYADEFTELKRISTLARRD